ncbi:propionyl-CoA synthetase [Actinocorallia sp. API 0066]|uniref:propionyl-CoA synthetase n=1 Tax=Actinocorallia sp. API 0066 TaxID=2896846 RepID=UPI001E4366C3|nr:propionyl-CoA synthetase [Actinocorallia sp. API 0066]MCD0451567.1 propionyl-CoA synthetase [Actinocorallia sp. API 0066]
MGAYAEAYRRSLADPEGFWGEAAGLVDWTTPPTRVLDASEAPFHRWFPGGELNTCANALDRHVEAGHGDRTALIWDSAMVPAKRSHTYRELRDEVARVAGALASLGVRKGDRVVVYMPMVPEAVMTMLACARLGAVHSVVFGGFAPKELAARIEDAEPKVVVAASCGLEPNRIVAYQPILQEALKLSGHRPEHVLMLQRDAHPADLGQPGYVDWAAVVPSAEPAEPVPVASSDPLYILYTSGTTGRPKGVLRTAGGHAVALAWSMGAVYDVGAGDVWWTVSDVGWVVGHSYIVYAPLLVGATTVVYEGKPIGTPDAGAFWRIVEEYGVKTIFTAPTAFRAIKKVDPKAAELAKYDVSSLTALFLAGERLDPETYQWASDVLGVPVTDHWWQTETGWPIAANPRGLEPMPVKPGSATVPVPGWDVRIVDESGAPVEPGREGEIVIRLPLPPGALATLWGDDKRFVASYLSRHEGFYHTGDSGYLDEDGYLFVMGRIDDVINVAGHRLSTGAIEAALATHPAVAECAVIGVPDALKGQLPYGLVVLKSGVEVDKEELRAELVAAVRRDVGAVAAFRDVAVVPALPKTRSGKILRRTMRGIAADRPEPVPPTIEDPAVLDALTPLLRRPAE